MRIETGEREVEVRFLDVLQLQSEQFLVPIGPRYRTVHHQPEGSSHKITDTSVMPSFRAAFRRRWPSTTSPPLRASTGILKPNSRIDEHMRSTAESFLRGLCA